MGKKVDRIGMRFGRLLVVKETDERKNGSVIWECMCDCGKVVATSALALKTGKTQSCGCLKDESVVGAIKVLTKHNAEIERVEGTSLSMLISKTSKNNTSGVKGVYRNKRRQLWFASIGFQNKVHFLGYFDKLEDAVKARKEAEEKYFIPILEKYGRLEEQN